MSESQEDAEKKKSDQKKADQTQDATGQPTKPTAPRVGTPIGQSPSPRPQIGTPIGTQSASTSSTTPARPTVGTPVGTPRPTVGTPKPTVGTPVGAPKPSAPVGTTAARPTVSTSTSPTVASVSKPAASKPPESKTEISRRNFIKGLAVLGGIVAIGEFVALGPYLQGSVGETATPITNQVIEDSTTGDTLTTTTAIVSSPNSWTTFVYPRTGNANIDNDTFRQCVLIHLPKGWTAGQYGAVDPISGDTFVALSRVCVHLWCLWSYVPSDDRGICPCHGSQYIPGGPAGSQNANNPGLAVAGPASLQVAPNNQLPVISLSIASDGTISATGTVGQIGCGQKC